MTPLQMARFYALIANSGQLVRPHIVRGCRAGRHGEARSRGILHRFTPPPPQPSGVDPTYLAIVQDGLYAGDSLPRYGTSSGVFGSFPVPIAGKTGTAEKVAAGLPGGTKLDQSWWCGYGPRPSKPPSSSSAR